MKVIDKNKLVWSCRRGMLELDLLIMPFFESEYDKLTDEEKYVFSNLLNESDLDLWRWLIKLDSSPDYYNGILVKIKQFRMKKNHK